MRILLTLQYLGTRYAGWQSQTNATAIQTVVEQALERLYAKPVRIEGAGRTDSGVHANGQRAHFDAPGAIPARGIVLGLNDLLPHDIRVTDAAEVSEAFHCRFAAKQKDYVYRVWNGSVADVFRWETHAHIATPLDVEAMREAAVALAGTHDFRAFTVAEPEVSSTIRTISAVQVAASPPASGPFHPAEREGAAIPAGRSIAIRVTADGFLRYMVRRIAGSLIEVGRGRLASGALAESLEPTFAEARWTAPAKGLVLDQVRY